MAKIEFDQYDDFDQFDNFDQYNEMDPYNGFGQNEPASQSAYSSGKDVRRSRKRLRSLTRTAVLVISAVCVVGAYPAGRILFDKVLESDREVNVIPDWVLNLFPSSALSGILDKVGGSSDTETVSPSSLSADQLSDADISDPNILAETTPVSDSYIQNSLFLGDERLQGFVDEELIGSAYIFSNEGISPIGYTEKEFTDSTTNVTGTIDTVVAARTPAQIYIWMGVNDLADNDTYLDAYRELITTLKTASPTSSIIICSILPINEENAQAGGVDSSITNALISSVNKKLLAMAREEDCFYLNVYSKVVDESSALSADYDKGGGILLNTDGYEALLSYIQKHAVPTS